MQHALGHAAWTWTCSMGDMDMQHGHGHAPWTCSMDIGMQYGHGQLDMQHGHGHAEWTWTCITDMKMDKYILNVQVDVRAACPCQCCMSTSVLHVHVRAACPCPCCKSKSVLHIHACSVSRWRPQKVDKRMVLEYTHGLFIT